MAAGSAQPPSAPAVLYVLRHARARTHSDGGDHERELKRSGRHDARVVGKFLARVDGSPDRIVSSSAARALETARLARSTGGFQADVEAQPRLYGASGRELVAALSELDAGTRVLLVGHEPSLSELIGLLTGADVLFPTSALARIDLAVREWSALAPRAGRLAWLVTPDVCAARLRPRRS